MKRYSLIGLVFVLVLGAFAPLLVSGSAGRLVVESVPDSALGRTVSVYTDPTVPGHVNVTTFINGAEVSDYALVTGLEWVRGTTFVREDGVSRVRGVAICGFDAQGAALVEYHQETSSGSGIWAKTGTYGPVSESFVDVAYSSERDELYLLEASQPRLLSAAMAASAAALPKVFSDTGANLAGVSLEEYQMSVGTQGVGTCEILLGRIEGIEMTRTTSTNYVINIDSLGNASRTDYEMPRNSAVIDSVGLKIGWDISTSAWLPTQVAMSGAPLGSLELVWAASGLVLSSGIADASGTLTLGVSNLVLGEYVGSRVTGETTIQAPQYVPYRSWGVVDPLLIGTIIPFGSYLGGLCYVGNQDFEPDLTINLAHPSTDAGTYRAWLAVGATTDRIHLGADRWLLNAPTVFETSFVIADSDLFRNAVPAFLMPIANDSGLAGTDVCFQWWIEDSDGGVKVSNVIELKIRASYTGASAAKSSSGPKRTSPFYGTTVKPVSKVTRLKLLKSIRKAR